MSQQEIVPASEDVAALAHAFGVSTEYRDQAGQQRVVPASSVAAVLDAFGVDVTSEAGIAAGWDRVINGPWRRLVPHTVVATEGQHRPVLAHVAHGGTVEVWLVLEDGRSVPLVQVEHLVEPRVVDGVLMGEAAFEVQQAIPLGWHAIHARTDAGISQQGVYVVTPAFLGLPSALQEGRHWGVMAQLYATRSEQSWGFGDLHDLGALAAWAGERGGDFVLVNPMHAAEPKGHIEPSPYLPATRRYFSPLYIRVEDVPEFATLSPEAQRSIAAAAAPLQATTRTAELIDRDPIWAAKRDALLTIFAQPLSADRSAAFDRYLAQQGPGLVQFARWCAFAEEYGTASQLWPEGLRHPQGPGIEAEAKRLDGAVQFHLRCQWVLDEQFASAQARAKTSGMASGIVHDLAVGVHPDGADSWALQDVMAKTMNVGAPPDMYNQLGQDWSQPPWRPDALAETGYAAYRDMLRTILAHAGGIRVDHALGLFRLWWIPVGSKPYDGTYVKFDHEAMVGILALEAQRAGAFVVGEDLGTVEPWIQEYLHARGILGTSILWFEHNDWGQPLEPERWRELCFASVTVHDLPPTAGMLQGEHIRIRHDLNLLTRSVDDEWNDWNRERGNWDRILRERGMLQAEQPTTLEFVEALHRFLGHTPAKVMAIGVPDIVGDIRAQNQPGTNREYPNWCVPTCDADGVAVTIEDLSQRADLRERADRLIAALSHR